MRGEVKIVIDRRRVVELMNRLGMSTFGELAEESGVHANSLVRILAGSGWQSHSLEALARTLGCHPFDLLVARDFQPCVLPNPGEPFPEETAVDFNEVMVLAVDAIEEIVDELNGKGPVLDDVVDKVEPVAKSKRGRSKKTALVDPIDEVATVNPEPTIVMNLDDPGGMEVLINPPVK